MSDTKEQITLSNLEPVVPDEEELAALHAYHNGDSEYQPSISQEDLMKKLGL